MTAFWICAALLVFPMVLFGGMKVVRPKDALEEMGMLWVADYSDTQVKLIGLAEVLGAIGVVVPSATGVLPVLAPVAAACLGVLMVGAFFVHVRRRDPIASKVITGALVSLSVAVVWLGGAA